MVKLVILGSCRFSPYEVLAKPDPIPDLHNTEEGYREACETFYPAIDEADVIVVYAPDGIGKHTARDVEYALKKRKKIYVLGRRSARLLFNFDREEREVSREYVRRRARNE